MLLCLLLATGAAAAPFSFPSDTFSTGTPSFFDDAHQHMQQWELSAAAVMPRQLSPLYQPPLSDELLTYRPSPRFRLHTPRAVDVCTIPSAPASQSRASVLTALAHSVASAMDPSQEPCANFYLYACGGWLAKHNSSTIPPDQSSWSKSSDTSAQQKK